MVGYHIATHLFPNPMLTFQEFVSTVYPRFQWYPHMTRLAAVLQRVATGDLRRVLIFMPPRHGKTLLTSHLFPAYYLSRYPDRFVGLSSYGAALAHTLSRNAQGYFRAGGGDLRREATGAGHWETTAGGGLWAAGTGGPLTGKGASLLCIDDPLKNAAEAASATVRNAQRDWYASTFYTRAEPEAAVVIIQTRWNAEDLSGWLLNEERQSDLPERWHIVSMPALYNETPADFFPPSCTVEPDFRTAGAALCPERFDGAALARIRARLGSYFWAALYQQQPRPAEGNVFKRDWLPIVPHGAVIGARVRYWDLAATANGGDYTVGVKVAVDGDGTYYVEDVVRGQWSPGARDKVILRTARQDGAMVKVVVEQEPGSSGVSAAGALVRLLAGYSVRAERVTGSKVVRAAPFAAQAEAGNVRVVHGTWNQAFVEELLAFPHGAHDDCVDAAAGAFNALARGRTVRVV